MFDENINQRTEYNYPADSPQERRPCDSGHVWFVVKDNLNFTGTIMCRVCKQTEEVTFPKDRYVAN